jgi:hypothetical protein
LDRVASLAMTDSLLSSSLSRNAVKFMRPRTIHSGESRPDDARTLAEPGRREFVG